MTCCEEEEPTLVCCGCDVLIVINSKEHDHSSSNDGENWYCEDCDLPDEDEESEECARCKKTFRYNLHDCTCDDCFDFTYFVCKDCEYKIKGCGICEECETCCLTECACLVCKCCEDKRSHNKEVCVDCGKCNGINKGSNDFNTKCCECNNACWTCSEPATHSEFRDALNENEYTCDVCHKEEYPEQYEEKRKKCSTLDCIGGQAFEIKYKLFCSPSCGNKFWDLKKGDNDYWSNVEDED